MNLSPNFTLEELTRTDTGLPNNPDWPETQRMFYLVNYILQPIREMWGPYRITSGYRSREVNKSVGGAEDSQHLFGEAADGYPLDADLMDVYKWIVDESEILYGQCILENLTWIHISLPRIGRKNQEALIYENGNYKPYFV